MDNQHKGRFRLELDGDHFRADILPYLTAVEYNQVAEWNDTVPPSVSCSGCCGGLLQRLIWDGERFTMITAAGHEHDAYPPPAWLMGYATRIEVGADA